MLRIEGNNITLTRGDSLTLTIALEKGGAAYEPEAGDSVRFAVSKNYLGDVDYQLMLEKAVPIDSLVVTLDSEETKLAYRDYNYDVQLTHANGDVDTVISGLFRIIGEVA